MDSSIAPKERINIIYKSIHENLNVEKELPLKILVIGEIGDFLKGLSLQDRDVININKANFNEILKSMNVKIEVDIFINNQKCRQVVEIDHIDDFSPDRLVKKTSHVENLLKVRNALLMLKGPIGNNPEFRKKLECILLNSEKRKSLCTLLMELGEAD